MATGAFALGVVELTHHQAERVKLPQWPSVTVKQAAEQTGYNEEYIRRLIRQGRIDAELLGSMYLIRLSSLQAYVAEMQTRDDARTGPKAKGE